ncbi:hypothetical protein M8C21_026374, partial [Ambrosia artemisiifolia]
LSGSMLILSFGVVAIGGKRIQILRSSFGCFVVDKDEDGVVEIPEPGIQKVISENNLSVKSVAIQLNGLKDDTTCNVVGFLPYKRQALMSHMKKKTDYIRVVYQKEMKPEEGISVLTSVGNSARLKDLELIERGGLGGMGRGRSGIAQAAQHLSYTIVVKDLLRQGNEPVRKKVRLFSKTQEPVRKKGYPLVSRYARFLEEEWEDHATPFLFLMERRDDMAPGDEAHAQANDIVQWFDRAVEYINMLFYERGGLGGMGRGRSGIAQAAQHLSYTMFGDIWTGYSTMTMAVSVLPFIVVQFPQIMHSDSGRHLAVIQPTLQRRRLAFVKHKHEATFVISRERLNAIITVVSTGERLEVTVFNQISTTLLITAHAALPRNRFNRNTTLRLQDFLKWEVTSLLLILERGRNGCFDVNY